MTVKEMRACAAKTLSLFIESMPDIPFGEDDVEIIFVTKKNISEHFKALCAKYSPDRPVTDDHCRQLENTVFANAIIGRGKSAVIIKTDYRIAEYNLRRIVFHELTHIYCAKTEMETTHFIDVFGSGHTPDMNPEDKVYDGCVNAGYFTWSEFIAEYTAVVKTSPEIHTYYDVEGYTAGLLGEAVLGNNGGKTAFGMASAYILSCADTDELLGEIRYFDINMAGGMSADEKANALLMNCLLHLYEHIRTEKPWKITEKFIYEFGYKYLLYVTANTLCPGVI